MSSSTDNKATKPEARHKGAGQKLSTEAKKNKAIPKAAEGESSTAKVDTNKKEKKGAVSSLTTKSLKSNPFIDKYYKEDPNMGNKTMLGSGRFGKVYVCANIDVRARP